MLDQLDNACIFSKLDHQNMYHQIRMMEDDNHNKKRFLLVGYDVMLLSNILNTFICLMHHIFTLAKLLLFILTIFWFTVEIGLNAHNA